MKSTHTMRYLSRYPAFLLREGVENKKFFLLSGPSASGKTYLAKKRGIEQWYENPGAQKILVGTDSLLDTNNFKPLSELISASGLPGLAKFRGDWPWLMEVYYKDDFRKWERSASEEEKQRYQELRKSVGYLTENDPKTKKRMGDNYDGRACGMAWVGYLTKATTVVFDDVDTTIKNYDVFKITDVLVYTPLDHYIGNIASRNKSGDNIEHIDVNEKDTAFYQYAKWFKATDKPDLDQRKFNPSEISDALSRAGHKNPKEILGLLGVKSNEDFYLTTNDGVSPDIIVNSRDKSSGRAKDLSALPF